MAQKKKRKNNSSTKAKNSPEIRKKNYLIFGTLLIVLAIALFLSFVSYLTHWKADQSLLSQFTSRTDKSQNLLSRMGNALGHLFVFKGVGILSFVFPVLLLFQGIYLALDVSKTGLISKWIWGLLIVIWGSIFLGFFASSYPILGGAIGFEINDFLKDYIGATGTVLLLLFALLAMITQYYSLTGERVKSLFKVFGELSLPKPIFSKTPSPEHSPSIEDVSEDEKIDPYTHRTEIPSLHPEEPNEEEKNKLDVSEGKLSLEIENTLEEQEEITIKAAQLVTDYGEFDPTLDLGNYKFPPLELLNNYGGTRVTTNEAELEENKNTIVSTLRNYSIGIAQIKATIGPTVTLYEIVPDAGIRISKIKNLEDDIAMSLAALGIRIIAPIPGKGTVGIEVPNKNPSIVSMRSVLQSKKFQEAEMELPIAFGKTISNETFVVDLAKMPHLLMAGATGQGKSVGLNAVLASLLYKKHPAEIKLVLVDPKKVELTLYNKIERHFLAKLPDSEEAIITDNNKVINTLNSLCIEMDNRYELLKIAMVRNIKEYNIKFKSRQLNPANGHQFLPYIILVIDEFADLIMTAGKEVETPIARLAQLARAIGIHLIIATQRPSVNVITGLIKANFPARIAFRVTSKIDSRTILDTQGADQLIGRGDMLFTQGSDVTRLQCAFMDTPEVAKITDFIGSQRAYPDAHYLPEYIGEDSGTTIDYEISERDSMFREAAEVVVISQQGSASLIQRKLKLGYNRAGRIIDQLEAAGIVGPFEGSKARQVLISDIYALDHLLENEKQNN